MEPVRGGVDRPWGRHPVPGAGDRGGPDFPEGQGYTFAFFHSAPSASSGQALVIPTKRGILR